METTSTASPPAKDCIARLLDLTAGWAYFAANEEGEYANPAYAAELYNLYQSIGVELSSVVDSDEAAKQAAVIKFVGQRLLPVLLGTPLRPAGNSPKGEEI